MFKRILYGLIFLAALCGGSFSALAQSNPGFYYGQVPTPAQWNAAFSAKQDVLGYTPVNKGGDVMLGRLVTNISSTAAAPFSIPPGVAPTAPLDGDIWSTSTGIFSRNGGVTYNISQPNSLSPPFRMNCPIVSTASGPACFGVNKAPSPGRIFDALANVALASDEAWIYGGSIVNTPTGAVGVATAVFGAVINGNWAGTVDNRGHSSYVEGGQFIAYTSGSAKIDNAYGSESDAVLLGSSFPTNAYGAYDHVDNESTGTVTTAAGLFAAISNVSGGAITNAVGVLINATTGIAGVTNVYGLKIGDQASGSSSNYAIFTGNGAVHFGDAMDAASITTGQVWPVAGNITFGSTSTNTSLIFRGNASQGPYLIRGFDGASETFDVNSAGAFLIGTLTVNNITTGTAADVVCLTAAKLLMLQAAGSCTISDPRLKENIHPFTISVLPAIMKMPEWTFRMKLSAVGHKDKNGKWLPNADPNARVIQLGLMATDVAKIVPLCATYYNDMKTPKAYRPECMIAWLAKGMKEQQAEIVSLHSENIRLHAANDNNRTTMAGIMTRLDRIERASYVRRASK